MMRDNFGHVEIGNSMKDDSLAKVRFWSDTLACTKPVSLA